MGRRRIFSILLIIILAAGAAALLTAFGIGGGKQHEAAMAQKGSIAGIIKESGDIEGEKDQVYFARVSAPVKSVDLKVGDLVKEGEVLLTYDTEDLERTVSEASISREQSEENAKGQIDKSNEYSAKYSKAASDDAAYAALYALEREYKNFQEEGQYKEDWDINRRRDSINSSIASKNEKIAEKKKDIAKSDDTDEIEELNDDIAELNEDIACSHAFRHHARVNGLYSYIQDQFIHLYRGRNLCAVIRGKQTSVRKGKDRGYGRCTERSGISRFPIPSLFLTPIDVTALLKMIFVIV